MRAFRADALVALDPEITEISLPAHLRWVSITSAWNACSVPASARASCSLDAWRHGQVSELAFLLDARRVATLSGHGR